MCTSTMWRTVRNSGVAIMVLAGTTRLSAQADTSKHAGRWLSAFSLGLPGVGREPASPQLFTIAGNFTQARFNRPGVDLAIGIMPGTLQYGLVLLGGRLDMAVPLQPSPGFILAPAAGVSVVAGGGPGGVGAVAGFNVGLSSYVFSAGSLGVRAGFSRHYFQDTQGAVWLVEFGIAHRAMASR